MVNYFIFFKKKQLSLIKKYNLHRGITFEFLETSKIK